jgi:hypothetical protein
MTRGVQEVLNMGSLPLQAMRAKRLKMTIGVVEMNLERMKAKVVQTMHNEVIVEAGSEIDSIGIASDLFPDTKTSFLYSRPSQERVLFINFLEGVHWFLVPRVGYQEY